jgi:hypothetical protein
VDQVTVLGVEKIELSVKTGRQYHPVGNCQPSPVRYVHSVPPDEFAGVHVDGVNGRVGGKRGNVVGGTGNMCPHVVDR